VARPRAQASASIWRPRATASARVGRERAVVRDQSACSTKACATRRRRRDPCGAAASYAAPRCVQSHASLVKRQASTGRATLPEKRSLPSALLIAISQAEIALTSTTSAPAIVVLVLALNLGCPATTTERVGIEEQVHSHGR